MAPASSKWCRGSPIRTPGTTGGTGSDPVQSSGAPQSDCEKIPLASSSHAQLRRRVIQARHGAELMVQANAEPAHMREAGKGRPMGRGKIERQKNVARPPRRALEKGNVPRRKNSALRLHIIRGDLELPDPHNRRHFPNSNSFAEILP
jgi:hypothetical protein